MRDAAPSASRRIPWGPILGGLGLLVVLYGGLSKALLVHSLQYDGSDFYSFLEMTWSWLYAGLLHDNVYGFHGAIHNFYLMPALAPLTIPLGAYGLVVALVLAYGAGVVRVAGHPALDNPARLAILAGALGPFAFFVVDNPRWGFHPEILYPPLALLLALDLLRGWTWRAVALAGAIVLVKEDGALVCLAVALAHTVWRWSVARSASPAEARRALRTGLVALVVFVVVFLAGMALLSWWSHRYAGAQTTSADRLAPALRAVVRTLSGHGRPRLDRLLEALPVYLLMSVLMLLPLGRRLPRGLLLFGVAAPPLLAVVVVSAAPYRFNMMLWAPRVATLQAAVVAALVFAAVTPSGRRPARLGVVALLAVASWVGQGAVLHGMGYSLAARMVGPGAGFGPPPSHLAPAEDRYLRCVASRLPWALPVSGKGKTYPVFHRQSVVFGSSAHNWHPARLRVVRAATASGDLASGICRTPAVGSFAIEAECDLLPLFADCHPGP